MDMYIYGRTYPLPPYSSS